MFERGVNGFSTTIHGAAKFRLCINLFYLPEKFRQCKEYENLSTNDISYRYFSKFYWEQYEKKTTTKFWGFRNAIPPQNREFSMAEKPQRNSASPTFSFFPYQLPKLSWITMQSRESVNRSSHISFFFPPQNPASHRFLI